MEILKFVFFASFLQSFLLAFIAIIISTFSAGGDYRAFQIKKEESTDVDEVPYAYGFFHFVFATVRSSTNGRTCELA
jgi:Kef-type K+ transport system membrane component KefB